MTIMRSLWKTPDEVATSGVWGAGCLGVIAPSRYAVVSLKFGRPLTSVGRCHYVWNG